MSSAPDPQAALLRELLALMDAQTAALGDIEAAYAADAAVQASRGYLRGWFPSRRDALARQRERIAPALTDAAYRRSDAFSSALRWYQSLGQAFDVDLAWSGREDEVFSRNAAMHRVARALDDRLEVERVNGVG